MSSCFLEWGESSGDVVPRFHLTRFKGVNAHYCPLRFKWYCNVWSKYASFSELGSTQTKWKGLDERPGPFLCVEPKQIINEPLQWCRHQQLPRVERQERVRPSHLKIINAPKLMHPSVRLNVSPCNQWTSWVASSRQLVPEGRQRDKWFSGPQLFNQSNHRSVF